MLNKLTEGWNAGIKAGLILWWGIERERESDKERERGRQREGKEKESRDGV